MLRQEQVRVCQGGNVADEVGLGKVSDFVLSSILQGLVEV